MPRWRGLDRYRDYLTGLGFAPRTIDEYERVVRRCAEWCEHNGERLTTMPGVTARAFADTLPATRSSRERARTALGHYWEMIGRDNPPSRAIVVPKEGRGRYRGTTQSRAARLVVASRGWYPEGTSVILGLYLGARRAELAALRWTDFDTDLTWARWVAKGNVTRELPLHPVLRAELARWRRPEGFLFPGSRGRDHVHPYTTHLWLEKVCDVAEVPRMTPHQMRHTAIATVNDTTRDIRAAQVFAGHARISTTERYTTVTEKRLHAAIEALNYLDSTGSD